jgi:hypothetical protein
MRALMPALAVLAVSTAAVAAPAPRPAAPPAAPAAPPAPSPTPKQAAKVDLTGWWVSVVTEDWRWRMMTPPKGDYTSVPLNAEGKRVADAWDIEKDKAPGLECQAYGAPALMRLPGRLHVTWDGDQALKVETDAGTQVRELRFGPPGPAGAPSWQGVSHAEWEDTAYQASGLGILTIPPAAPSFALKVTTTGLRAGYLRRNGVPYSAGAVVTEYYDTFRREDGTDWLVVTTVVDDPRYLQQPFITSTHFKREADGAKWSPSPCKVIAPTRGPRPAYPQ